LNQSRSIIQRRKTRKKRTTNLIRLKKKKKEKEKKEKKKDKEKEKEKKKKKTNGMWGVE